MNLQLKSDTCRKYFRSLFDGYGSKPLFIVLAFFLFTLPFASHYHLYYPDEMYYTDGALCMQQEGDYLTPRHWSGAERFNKPILTYYVVLLGHSLFGVSPFSSRILFLLAGSITILLVFFAARIISRNDRTAALSAMIVSSHPTLILSSTRSIPDILLALFLTLSVLGIAGILRFGNKTPVKYLWFFYLGIALAFSVKGLPAVALGGLAWLYLLINPWKKIAFSKVWHWPSIVSSLAVASWWFIVVYCIHGTTFIEGFLGDQVGVRVGSVLLRSLLQFVLASVLMLALFFPWFAFLPWKKGKIGAIFLNADSDQKSYIVLVFVWIIAIVMMSALVAKFYERYLLPVVPAMAILVAIMLDRYDFSRRKVSWVLFRFLNWINLLMVALAILMSVAIGNAVINWVILSVSVCVLFASFSLRKPEPHLPQWITLNILLILFVSTVLTHPISLPGMGEQAKYFLDRREGKLEGPVAFSGDQYHGSRIRLGMGVAVKVDNYPEGTGLENLRAYNYLVVDEKIKDQIDTSFWSCETLTSNWEEIPAGEIFWSLFSGQFDEVRRRNLRNYYWMERKCLNNINKVSNISQ